MIPFAVQARLLGKGEPSSPLKILVTNFLWPRGLRTIRSSIPSPLTSAVEITNWPRYPRAEGEDDELDGAGGRVGDADSLWPLT